MNNIVRAASLLAGLLLATAASADGVLGKMGDAELHNSELAAVLETQPVDARRQLGSDPAALERLVRSELMRKAVLNEARQKGWDKRPELQPLIERARDQVVVSSFVANIAKPPGFSTSNAPPVLTFHSGAVQFSQFGPEKGDSGS